MALIDELIAASGVVPVVNQIEWTPFDFGEEMMGYCKEKNIKKVEEKKSYKGRPRKISKREKRVIKRDILRSPKKINKRLIIENNLGITKRSL